MPIFITIGGPPGSGKSTLVRNLIDKLDASYVDDHSLGQMIDCKKRSKERTILVQHLCHFLLAFLVKNKKNLVFEVPPNHVNFFLDARELLNRKDYSYYHFFLKCDIATCIQRKKDASPMGGKYWNTPEEIIKDYYLKTIDSYKNFHCNVIDTTFLSPEEVLNKIFYIVADAPKLREHSLASR